METSDFYEMSTDDLERHFDELTESIARIKGQIEDARFDVREYGQYSKRDWFRKANYALRMKGAEHQIVQREIGRRAKKAKEETHIATLEYNARVERNFVALARQRMDGHEFSDLMAEAVAIAETKKQENGINGCNQSIQENQRQKEPNPGFVEARGAA